MKVEYVIQYQNHPLGGWHDYKGPLVEYVGQTYHTIEPWEKVVNALRDEQPKRSWRLVERTEEVIY